VQDGTLHVGQHVGGGQQVVTGTWRHTIRGTQIV
jgi:hypothetical protein